ALGAGAWSAAIFHFLVHAFFKALLFLCAGAIMLATQHERDMFKMGGLRGQLPLIFWTFLIGSASLSAIPFVTAGFYSKEAILRGVWASHLGLAWLGVVGLTGAFLTSLYSFRMVFLVFFGPAKSEARLKPSFHVWFPLLILAGLTLGCGFLEIPRSPGGISIFSGFLAAASPVHRPRLQSEFLLPVMTSFLSLGGIFAAYLFFLRLPHLSLSLVQTAAGGLLKRFWFSGWGFEWFYHLVFLRPFLWFTRINKNDFFDLLSRAPARVSVLSHEALRETQSGNVRWYGAVFVLGAVIMVAVAVFL
ncbi:MAG: proton-conducting transporter membrane subunit, partial [bacterium]|nr:proton-conducting transporter membrane subunit [bacterium]